jgi:hypothetical protein
MASQVQQPRNTGSAAPGAFRVVLLIVLALLPFGLLGLLIALVA